MMYRDSHSYDTFLIYQAIRLHFTTSYDFYKYGGVIPNMSEKIFNQRSDKFNFYKLSRQYSILEFQNFCVANFVYGEDAFYTRNLLKEDAKTAYRKWKTINESLTYRFTNDTLTVMDQVENPQELMLVPPNGYPKLLSNVFDETITTETLIIMDDLLGFMPMWSKKIEDTVVFPGFKIKCEKYKPFINYDKIKFKKVLLEAIPDHKMDK